MPLLRDRGQLEKIRKALCAWPEKPKAISWLSHAQQELQTRFPDISVREVSALMAKHCQDGGDINRVEEPEPSLRAMGKDCFYEFRIKVEEHEVYVKARLMHDRRDGDQLYIVSCHKGHDK